MEENRDKFKIDADYNNTTERIEYTLYRFVDYVWVKVTTSKRLNKIYKIMEQLQEYPKIFLGQKIKE